MTVINPYLNFNGNCEDVFTFYKSVFNAEFSYLGRFGDMPPDQCEGLSEHDKNKIMHVSIPIQGDNMLMGSDIMDGYGPPFVQGTNFSLSIGANSKQEADRLFAKLSDGGFVVMPMEITFWGDYFGMLVDKFGINWMIGFNDKNQNNG